MSQMNPFVLQCNFVQQLTGTKGTTTTLGVLPSSLKTVTPKVTELLVGVPNQAALSKCFLLFTFNCHAGMGGQVQSPVMLEF